MSDDWCPENDGAYRMELAARERDTIATLRARLEQAERERDAALGEATGFSVRDYHDGKEAGFRAGIEAAANLSKWHSDTLTERIRALSPAPSTDKPCKTCKGTGYTDAVIDDRCGRCNETGVEPSADNTTTVVEVSSHYHPAIDAFREAQLATVTTRDMNGWRRGVRNGLNAALRALAAQKGDE